MSSWFKKAEFLRTSVCHPEAMNSGGKNTTKDGTDGHAGDKIAFFGDRGDCGTGIVSLFRVIEAAGHIVCEGNRAGLADELDQGWF